MNQRNIVITRRIHLPSPFFNLEVEDQDGDITEKMYVLYIIYLILIILIIGEEEEDRGSECTEETPVRIPPPLPLSLLDSRSAYVHFLSSQRAKYGSAKGGVNQVKLNFFFFVNVF